MTTVQELEKARAEARNVEWLTNWRSWMPYMEFLGYAYDRGEPRAYYREKRGYYYYRVVTESEMHRNK